MKRDPHQQGDQRITSAFGSSKQLTGVERAPQRLPSRPSAVTGITPMSLSSACPRYHAHVRWPGERDNAQTSAVIQSQTSYTTPGPAAAGAASRWPNPGRGEALHDQTSRRLNERDLGCP